MSLDAQTYLRAKALYDAIYRHYRQYGAPTSYARQAALAQVEGRFPGYQATNPQELENEERRKAEKKSEDNALYGYLGGIVGTAATGYLLEEIGAMNWGDVISKYGEQFANWAGEQLGVNTTNVAAEQTVQQTAQQTGNQALQTSGNQALGQGAQSGPNYTGIGGGAAAGLAAAYAASVGGAAAGLGGASAASMSGALAPAAGYGAGAAGYAMGEASANAGAGAASGTAATISSILIALYAMYEGYQNYHKINKYSEGTGMTDDEITQIMKPFGGAILTEYGSEEINEYARDLSAGEKIAEAFIGTGKHRDQVARDRIMRKMEDSGLVEYTEREDGKRSHHIVLPDGTKFDIGTEEDQTYNVDLDDAFKQELVSYANPLATIMTGGRDKADKAKKDLVGFFVNAAAEASGGDMEKAKEHIRYMYEKIGMDQGEAFSQLEQLEFDEHLRDNEKAINQVGVNALYGQDYAGPVRNPLSEDDKRMGRRYASAMRAVDDFKEQNGGNVTFEEFTQFVTTLPEDQQAALAQYGARMQQTKGAGTPDYTPEQVQQIGTPISGISSGQAGENRLTEAPGYQPTPAGNDRLTQVGPGTPSTGGGLQNYTASSGLANALIGVGQPQPIQPQPTPNRVSFSEDGQFGQSSAGYNPYGYSNPQAQPMDNNIQAYLQNLDEETLARIASGQYQFK